MQKAIKILELRLSEIFFINLLTTFNIRSLKIYSERFTKSVILSLRFSQKNESVFVYNVSIGQSVVPIYIEHWGDNLQFYPNFVLFSTLGGTKLNHDFFHVHVKTKKGPNIIQHSDADHRQIIGGVAGADHSQIFGGMQSNYCGDISPPSTPRVSAPLRPRLETKTNC